MDSENKSDLENLLTTLITVSEKAANIARRMRENQLENAIERKAAGEANPRFLDDFKTLADVLIQTMVKRHIDPRIRVDGEENDRFYSVSLAREVVIELGASTEDNVAMLNKVLDDPDMAETYIHEVEKDVNLHEVYTKVPIDDERLRRDFDHSQLGVWIDPIDATNEFIAGREETNEEGVYTKGLKCVTVLIGVYDDYGAPVLGVINQPFFDREIDSGFKCNWGVYFAGIKANSLSPSASTAGGALTICVGAGEEAAIIAKLKRAGHNILVASGAGYKLLCVIKGIADAYVLTKATTYFWDTCAAHAILLSMGGGIVEATGVRNKEKRPLTYRCRGEDASKCHEGGIVAYRNESVLNELIVALSC